MNTMPMLVLLVTILLAIYAANNSWSYAIGGSIGLLFVAGWLLVRFNY